jgi:hypothetical protein
MSKDTFFFEEDPQAEGASGLTGKEHAEAFFSVLEQEGIIKDRQGVEAFDELKAQSEISTQTERTSLVEVEYGIVKADYVVHVTPIHPVRNLSQRPLFEQAVKQCVVLLSKAVPVSLRVDIYLPQPDWQIKATSFVIRDAADTWNFDAKAVEAAIPDILEQVTKICAQA